MRFRDKDSEERTQELNQSYGISGSYSIRQGAREKQQDTVYLSVGQEGCVLAVICDGMGGMEGGERASQITLDTFVKDFESVRGKEENYYPFLRKEVDLADELVFGLTDNQGRKLDSGTTLVAAVVENGLFQYMAVGDSRIYLIRDATLYQITRDHNYLLLLEHQKKNNMITEENYQYEKHFGEGLISYIGMNGVAIADGNQRPFLLEENDIIIMCSDGLYKALDDKTILKLVQDNISSVKQIDEALQDAAADAALEVQDNTSIIVMRYQKI